jgi:hypothetical protein
MDLMVIVAVFRRWGVSPQPTSFFVPGPEPFTGPDLICLAEYAMALIPLAIAWGRLCTYVLF